MSKELPEIAELVLYYMPDATKEEQIEATANLREYLGVIYNIFLRLEREGKLDTIVSVCDCGCDDGENS